MNILISQMDRQASDGGVVTVHWRTEKTVGDHTASQYGTESFTPDPQAPGFVPFAQLTEAMVKGWLTDKWGADGVAAKEAALDAQLAEMTTPKQLSGMPWSN